MAVHREVETSEGAKALLSGKVTKEEYVRFLMMLWHVYAAIELALDKHAANPTLEPTYNPTLLRRAPALAEDISFLLQIPESTWKTHPIHQALIALPPTALTRYVDRIHELSDMKDPSPLLSHAYVRYLGDLSGGQTIRHTLAKAYQLDEASGQGLTFYAFKELKSAKPANQGEMKRIKEWYREGMNAGAGDNQQKKATLGKEAQDAFIMNAGIFSAIYPTDEEKQKRKELEQENVLILPLETKKAEKGYPIASVAALIVAVSLGHFALTVGGFTGNSGYGKLLALEEWIATTWKSFTQ